jgi:glycosyltransferase involved in cell wall biosynthesis
LDFHKNAQPQFQPEDVPKVSIIIPAYNAMQYLPETVASALNQTYRNFEIVLVNDGSSDNIQEWVEAQTIPQLRLISQENRGLSGARNTGIREARGTYIALLDADDLWEPTKLAKQVQVLDLDEDIALVYTWMALVDEQGISTGRYYKRSEEGNVWKPMLTANLVGCGSVPLIRRTILDKVGDFDENLKSFVEDWDLWLRIARQHKFGVVKESLTYYRQRGDSASKNWVAMERSYKIVIDKTFGEDSPAELFPLKAKFEAFIYVNLGWMALQGNNFDCSVASNYRNKSFRYYPLIILEWEFFRLSWAIFLVKYFGRGAYNATRSILSVLRNGIKITRL